jgi:hypothetical protein
MINSKALFHYSRHYYLLVVLPIPSNHIALVLSNHPSSPPYPRTESTLGTRDKFMEELMKFYFIKPNAFDSTERYGETVKASYLRLINALKFLFPKELVASKLFQEL